MSQDDRAAEFGEFAVRARFGGIVGVDRALREGNFSEKTVQAFAHIVEIARIFWQQAASRLSFSDVSYRRESLVMGPQSASTWPAGRLADGSAPQASRRRVESSSVAEQAEERFFQACGTMPLVAFGFVH